MYECIAQCQNKCVFIQALLLAGRSDMIAGKFPFSSVSTGRYSMVVLRSSTSQQYMKPASKSSTSQSTQERWWHALLHFLPGLLVR